MKKDKLMGPSVRWKLSREATEMLRGHKPVDAALVVDLLGPRDVQKREERRQKLNTTNSELLDRFLSTKLVPSSEDLLLQKEAEATHRKAFLALFSHFQADKVATKILVASLSSEVPFRSSQGFVKKYGFNLKEVMAAKQRIKYFADVTTDPAFRSMLESFKGAWNG